MGIDKQDWTPEEPVSGQLQPRSLDERIGALVEAVDPSIRIELQRSLRTLRSTGHTTAVVLSASRLALKLVTEMLARNGQRRPTDSLYDCIVRIGSGDPGKKILGLQILPGELVSYLHTIRVLSNKIDHAVESILMKNSDGETALALFLRVLEWYYCEYSEGPQIRGLYHPSVSAEDPAPWELAPPVVSMPKQPPTNSLKIALLYKRHAKLDEALIEALEAGFRSKGHQVFIDRHMAIGVNWAREIEDHITASDAVVPLLSGTSVESEMIGYEVRLAAEAAVRNGGRPRLLPVRVGFDGALPSELHGFLERLQYFKWNGPQDSQELIRQLLRAVLRPDSFREVKDRLEAVGGAVPLDSKFYISRPTDPELHACIVRRDPTVLVKGARQMGKTSLLARGLQCARSAKLRVVFTDLQKLSSSQMSSPENLLVGLGEMLSERLDLSAHPMDSWKRGLSANVNFDRFMRKVVLEPFEEPLVWGLDEADRLFSCPFGSEIFGLFRTWHNERALEPDGPWSKLTLAIAYATEAHLFIRDLNQSPFNVGTRVELEDFTRGHLADLNSRHGSPLDEETELDGFIALIGGQPFLARRGLQHIVSRSLTFSEFEHSADRESGPFGDHLRRLLMVLAQDQDLAGVVAGILRSQPCPTPESFFRLRSAGIIKGESSQDARFRCRIYETFFSKYLEL